MQRSNSKRMNPYQSPDPCLCGMVPTHSVLWLQPINIFTDVHGNFRAGHIHCRCFPCQQHPPAVTMSLPHCRCHRYWVPPKAVGRKCTCRCMHKSRNCMLVELLLKQCTLLLRCNGQSVPENPACTSGLQTHHNGNTALGRASVCT